MSSDSSSFRVSEAAHAREERAIRLLLEATASKTGKAFFKALVQSLSEALNTSTAWVTEYLPDQRRLRSLAMWSDGRFVDRYEYEVAGTPCEPVIASCALTHFASNVIDLFPNDPDLPPLKAMSYVGAPFTDAQGRLLGHVAALDSQPMPREKAMLSVVQLFAARAGAEYEREAAVAAVAEREERLALLLDTAMDSILILDQELTIEQANRSALALFGCSTEDLKGEPIADFLAPSSIRDMITWAQRLADSAGTDSSFWIPEGSEVQRWDRITVPVEASLSRYAFRGQSRFTLIMRNIDERLEAQKRIELLSQEAEYMRSTLDQIAGPDAILGNCRSIRQLRESIRRLAPTDTTALILGETGTGKELVARGIHHASLRRDRPLVSVNCGAIAESLMESEFFGHEKGAFTGATERRIGRFERANRGTLFLDEIGELPSALQAKLLRVLQEGALERVGGSETVEVDVRIIAATHRDLQAMVKEGAFREDLLYRLNVFPLYLPPLRERGKDILLLAEAFIERLRQKMGRRFEPLSDTDRKLLLSYHWPGNARELQNVIERAMIQATGRRLQLASALPASSTAVPPPDEEASTKPILTEAEMRSIERANIARALEASNGAVFGKDGAAARLGIKPTTLASRIKKLGIRPRA